MSAITLGAHGLKISLVGSDGAVVEATEVGAHGTWFNAWAKLPPALPKDLVLKVTVDEGEFFAYNADHFTRDNGRDANMTLLDNTDRTVLFEARKGGMWTKGTNVCVVMMHSDSFDTFEVSVQRTGSWQGVVVQKTWHGHVFNKGGKFCCPRLERQKVSYKPLRDALALRYDVSTLPKFTSEVGEHFEDRIKYSLLGKYEYVVTAMASTGAFFGRDHEGNFVHSNIRDVVSAGCPVPTVGTIVIANRNSNNGLLTKVEFITTDKFSQMCLDKTYRTLAGMRAFGGKKVGPERINFEEGAADAFLKEGGNTLEEAFVAAEKGS